MQARIFLKHSGYSVFRFKSDIFALYLHTLLMCFL
jgi:hypothetical protein